MIYLYIKRFFDFLSSFVAIIILLPIMLPIMIGLMLTGEGHVWYFQKRIGQHNKYFDIWKFATMLKDSPNLGTGMITLRKDPRVTPMGGFLRKSKINELPQLINVLFGTMSIVGPRPVDDSAFSCYSKKVQDVIYNSKPGITGIGSIIFRDEEELLSNANGDPRIFYREHIAPYKGSLELWYQEHISFFTDLKIIFITFWVIVFPKSDIVNSWFPDLPKRKKISA